MNNPIPIPYRDAVHIIAEHRVNYGIDVDVEELISLIYRWPIKKVGDSIRKIESELGEDLFEKLEDKSMPETNEITMEAFLEMVLDNGHDYNVEWDDEQYLITLNNLNKGVVRITGGSSSGREFICLELIP